LTIGISRLFIIGIGADNLKPIIGRLFVSVSKTTKNVLGLTAVHIHENEVLFILHRLLNTGMGWAVP